MMYVATVSKQFQVVEVETVEGEITVPVCMRRRPVMDTAATSGTLGESRRSLARAVAARFVKLNKKNTAVTSESRKKAA